MPNGYATPLLVQAREVAQGNAPGSKINLAGFLKMLFCCQNSSVTPLNQAFENGHQRPLTVKYRKRATAADVSDEPTCDVDRIPGYSEWTLPSLMYRQTSFFLSDDEISKYEQEASRSAGIAGTNPTGFMQEHFSLFVEHAAILLNAINLAMVSTMATKFGTNIVDAGTIGRVLNINRNGADLALNDGIVGLLRELRTNNLCADPCIVGEGIIAAYDMARVAQCCSNAGFDPGRLAIPQIYPDYDTQSQWGANSFGVFEKGSVKFIGRNQFEGNFAGQKGNSLFFKVPFPVAEFPCVDMAQCLRDLAIDVQIRYHDCPTTINVNGTPTAITRGYQVILSKYFGLWVQPTTGYDVGDPLAGTNGTLKYFATNDAGSPGIDTYDPTP